MWDTEVWRPCCNPLSHTPFWSRCSPCLRLQERGGVGREAASQRRHTAHVHSGAVTLPSSVQSTETFLTEICKMATAEPETNPSPTQPDEDGAEETGQEIVSPEAYIKHPLQNRWSLWFFKNDKSKTWQANLRLISKFDTVEDFWALYNHIQLSSNLMSGCDYSLFKDGIEPMWEDERNKRGGRWLITLTKQQRRLDLDRYWLETLLCLVGEAFDDYSDDVCGAVVNIRTKGDKIAVWTSDYENREAVTHIGRVYKERLGLPMKMTIGYQSHADTATKSGSTTKNKFVV
uniref:Eukaryotic translation initiation factor 4eb n=2 Tax=Lates TaxID=8186 RepID=A0A4W6F8A3_LATCA